MFTTRTETNDPVLFWGFALGALLNGVIALQMVLYRNEHDVEVVQKRADGRLEHAHTVTGVDRKELPAVAAAQPGGLATPVKQVAAGGAAKQSPASAGSARRYVRKLD